MNTAHVYPAAGLQRYQRDHLRRLIQGEIAVYQYLRKGRPAPMAVLRWQGVAITLSRVSVRNKAAAARRLLPKIQELLALRAAANNSLAQAIGWGSAGQCPANDIAKTPAAQQSVLRVAGTGRKPDGASADAAVHAVNGVGVV